MAEHRMHRISAYDSVSGRHAAYQRELERLATECEDFVEVLRDMKLVESTHVADRLDEALDRIFAAGRVEAAQRQSAAGSKP